MKLSVLILCYNSRTVIGDCLKSLFSQTASFAWEVIVADNFSTDGTVELVRRDFPKARVVENRGNIGFSAGNNRALAVAHGEYVLILNPDTIVHEGTLSRWIEFADGNQTAGAFGCRVVYPDGAHQDAARPFPTPARVWFSALGLRRLAPAFPFFTADVYPRWRSNRSREVDWVSGCALLVRTSVARELGGFDEQFFYHYDDVDLCRRIRDLGASILYAPEPSLVHIGGNRVGKLPLSLETEKCRNYYRYFHKHHGQWGAHSARWAMLSKLALRVIYHRLRFFFGRDPLAVERARVYLALLSWNARLDLSRFFSTGEEPRVREAA